MKYKGLIITIFIIMVMAQIFIPVKMIYDRENVLTQGKEYKFKVAPIDPNDPFRGKYVSLNYDGFSINSDTIDPNNWSRKEEIYLTFYEDKDGFSNIKTYSKTKSDNDKNYLKTTVAYCYGDKLIINIPFDRYYMNESKADTAEVISRNALRDKSNETYALVNILDGDAVLKDVYINGVPLSILADKKE